MGYSNRSDWSRDRNEQRDDYRDRQFSQRDWDDDDSRRARESMERDHYGNQMSGGRRHYGNESGGWQGREEEQWRNRDAHGHYDREANYGGFSSSGTGNYRGYGGSGGSYPGASQGDYNYRGYERSREDYGQQRLGQGYGEPSHRGQGPRGYKRSDDRIREDVCECLTDDDRLDASNIEVTVKEGEVTLSGSITSRGDKRWAESLAERIAGVKEVQNNLRIQDQQRSQTAGAGRTGDKGIQH